MTVSLGDFAGRFNSDVGARKLVLVVCECSIEYWGRGRSVIDEGDRLLFVKPDSTLIVHSVSGFKPVNWMSSPTDTVAEVEDDGGVFVYSQRTREPYEEMKVKVRRVIDYQSYEGLVDKKKIKLTHNELDMRDYLADNPKLVDPDFKLKSKEYRSPLGFFDLYGKIGDVYTVVELKAERAGLPAALQIKRYRDWLREHMKGSEVAAMLMAPSITPNALKLLGKEKIEFKKFSTSKIKRRERKHTLEKWLQE